jgi:hypothetical protein
VGNLAQYTLLFETANGALLAQEQAITIRRSTNSQPVATVALGYAGESPGAPMMEVTVRNALPANGIEFDPGPAMAGLIPVSLYTLGPGGKQLKGECFIHEDSIQHSVNSPAEITFNARGPMTLWL